MATYTVVGLRPDEGGLLVAGVYEGHQESVCEQNLTVGHKRWAQTYEAASPLAAEVLALLEWDAPELEWVFVSQLDAGDVVVYGVGDVDVLAEDAHIVGDDVRLRFESGNEAVYDTSALVKAVSSP